MRTQILVSAILFLAVAAQAQTGETETGSGSASEQPQVRLNYMNVCRPDAQTQQQIVSALTSMVPVAKLAPDYEQTRGRSTGENEVVWYLRLRREFVPKSAFSTAQYTVQEDGEKVTEILVLHPRDSKSVLEITLEGAASLQAGPVSMLLSMNSPVTRIKIERFGAASIGLSRCEEVDQSAYDGLFQQATKVFAEYRAALGLKSQLRSDLAWLQEKASPAKEQKKVGSGKK